MNDIEIWAEIIHLYIKLRFGKEFPQNQLVPHFKACEDGHVVFNCYALTKTLGIGLGEFMASLCDRITIYSRTDGDET